MVGGLLLRSGLRVASLRSSAATIQQQRGIKFTRPVCAQGVEKKITQEGTGASPQRGQKVDIDKCDQSDDETSNL
jgi:hypothetical protein